MPHANDSKLFLKDHLPESLMLTEETARMLVKQLRDTSVATRSPASSTYLVVADLYDENYGTLGCASTCNLTSGERNFDYLVDLEAVAWDQNPDDPASPEVTAIHLIPIRKARAALLHEAARLKNVAQAESVRKATEKVMTDLTAGEISFISKQVESYTYEYSFSSSTTTGTRSVITLDYEMLAGILGGASRINGSPLLYRTCCAKLMDLGFKLRSCK